MSKKNYVDISNNSLQYVENIHNGIDTERNFELLLISFKPIIKSVINSIKHNGAIEYMDLEQLAHITLWECCLKYDFENNKKALFYTYYYSCAYYNLFEYAYVNQLPITMNEHEYRRCKKIRNFTREYYDRTNTYPTVEHYINNGFSEKLARRYLDYVMNMNYAKNGLEDIEQHQDVCANSNVEAEHMENELYQELYNRLGELEDKYRKVIELRYLQGKTYVEISKELKISRPTIDKYEAKALAKLKINLKDFI